MIRLRWILRAGLSVIVLAACTGPTPTPSPTPSVPTPTATLELTAAPTWTPEPTPHPQQLVVCATEPKYASPFAPSQSANDLLALFYEEPLERVGHRWEARLVERVPSVATGDVITARSPFHPAHVTPTRQALS